MSERSFLIDSPTGAALQTYRTEPERPARAVLLVLHGLAEHAGRHRSLALELARGGLAVYVHDHRGHGSTTAIDAPLRRFAGKGGPAKLTRDVHAVRQRAEAEHPGCPVFVLGHSMGAHLALNYAQTYGEGLAGLLLWNASFERGWQMRLGRAALKAEKALKGSDVASAVFARATFEIWSKSMTTRRTAFDWLSHDEQVVDRYIADPLCGWTPTISMVEDLFALIDDAMLPGRLAKISRRLPIHCLGGSDDPATAGGTEVRRLAVRLQEAGSLDVTCHIVEGARHETLNERDPQRDEALRELMGFIDHHAAVAPKPFGAL
ncbi:alpha/beta fold hydrolase [Aureimonas pseudogalii]|uniref:Alpha-beta hydrolase superfamily lysophospholipase n=1 Tax=Aureimonas pseudogalii TaxID=1744844 RepID=A0A7W6EB53_9HYPH|nr:alpha/beta hydrolase [Aureimonas pseudogalii]MBB3998108.1 alpha-beta hydrolase superfamily lysophospholipase [Aureimonas pseudogalii]